MHDVLFRKRDLIIEKDIRRTYKMHYVLFRKGHPRGHIYLSFSDFRILKKDICEDIYICPFVLEDIRRTNIPKGIYMSLTVHTGVCTPPTRYKGAL